VVREPPGTVRFLLDRHPDQRRFKVANSPHTHDPVTFATPDNPDLRRFARRFLSSLGGGSNLIWSISSIDANLALPLSRRSAATAMIESEARGESPRLPGHRFIDSIGLRYLISNRAMRGEPHGSDFVEVYSEGDFGFFIRENRHVQSMFRVFPSSQAKWVDDYREAISEWQRPQGAALVLEGNPPEGSDPEQLQASTTWYGSIGRATTFPNAYSIEVSTREPGFLFIADTHYPGWIARVSGEPARVYAANVLGKAVAIPSGTSIVEVAFEPASFRAGAIISLIALVAGTVVRFGANRFAM
jgi:hypothetical protein